MRLAKLRFLAFSVPFKRPYSTSAGVAARRQGLLCRLETDGGVAGAGEGSCLPHVPFDRHLIEEQAEQARQTLEGTQLERPFHIALKGLPLPVRAAVEIAVWDALARTERKPLARLLAPQAAAEVPVNALLPGAPTIESIEAGVQAVARGYRTLKLKVGEASDYREDVRKTEALRDAIGPGPALRLDANGAWGEQTAASFLREVAPCSIEYVEQPLPPGNLAANQRLRSSSEVALAADEEITSPASAFRVLKARAADVLVLKPLALGGIGPCLEIAAAAQASGAGVTITTSIDSGIGTAAALHAAAALAPRWAAGLATLDLLEDDLIQEGLPVASGQMALPAGLGLGVSIDDAALEEFAAVKDGART